MASGNSYLFLMLPTLIYILVILEDAYITIDYSHCSISLNLLVCSVMPSSEPVRLGRKRELSPCPNPLFLRWLTELRDQAKERGLKTQHVYQKVGQPCRDTVFVRAAAHDDKSRWYLVVSVSAGNC